MSLVTEDGTGLANAESYISVANAITYHTNRGNTSWVSLTTTQQEQSLRLATDYMMSEYRLMWLGRRVLITQALDWPRVGVILEDFGGSQGRKGMGSYGLFQVAFNIVPTEVAWVCAEFALRAGSVIGQTSPLDPDQSQNVLKEIVGPISIDYDPDSPQQIRYRQLMNKIRVYMLAGGSAVSMKLVRA